MAFPIIAERLFDKIAKEMLTPDAAATIMEPMSPRADPLQRKANNKRYHQQAHFNCPRLIILDNAKNR